MYDWVNLLEVFGVFRNVSFFLICGFRGLISTSLIDLLNHVVLRAEETSDCRRRRLHQYNYSQVNSQFFFSRLLGLFES